MTYVVEETCKDGQVLAWGFATISDALDYCEEIDPDESRGVYARLSTVEESTWGVPAEDRKKIDAFSAKRVP